MKSTLLASLFALFALPVFGKEIQFCEMTRCAQKAVHGAVPGIQVEQVDLKRKRGYKHYQVVGHRRDTQFKLLVAFNGGIIEKLSRGR